MALFNLHHYISTTKKRQFESGLFLAINRNSKQVDADTLILVQSILDPTSREGLSRKVIEKMNTCEPFEKMFKLTKVSDAPISISMSSALLVKGSFDLVRVNNCTKCVILFARTEDRATLRSDLRADSHRGGGSVSDFV